MGARGPVAALAATALAAVVLAACNGMPAETHDAPSTTTVQTTTAETPAATATHDDSDGHTHDDAELSGGPDVHALPLGDQRYSSAPRQGYVYACRTDMTGGGAQTYGPWIDTNAGTWDLTSKVSVDGRVSWHGKVSIGTSAAMRTITSNDLPTGHTTGRYPIASSDDAYKYDTNPNSIQQQTFSFQVPLNPTVNATPTCVGGEVGIATTGVALFSAFDAGGRDAVAVEVQDHCQGHPQSSGAYHYHGYSSCFDDPQTGEHSPLLGYAFDGFGIYGIYTDGGVELSTSDLDECHGHTGLVEWDGKMVTMYHYHFTQDFPYTVSCFRGTPSVKALTAETQGGGQGPSAPDAPDSGSGNPALPGGPPDAPTLPPPHPPKNAKH